MAVVRFPARKPRDPFDPARPVFEAAPHYGDDELYPEWVEGLPSTSKRFTADHMICNETVRPATEEQP